MLKRFCFLLVLVLLIPVLSGCSNPLKASLDTQFTLSPGQTARIDSESMNIKFIGETQDSRCATGVECIRAGDVSCDIEITKDGTKNPITLTDTADQVLLRVILFRIIKLSSPYLPILKRVKQSPRVIIGCQ